MNGYTMVDCGGLELTSQTQQTIKGLYERSKRAFNKGSLILAYNCKYDSKVCSAIPVFGVDYDSEIIFTSSILQIHVKPTDKVTITNMATA